MADNQKQYDVTRSWVAKFTKKIEELEAAGGRKGVDPRLYRVMIDGYKALRDELQEEAAEYEKTAKSQ